MNLNNIDLNNKTFEQLRHFCKYHKVDYINHITDILIKFINERNSKNMNLNKKIFKLLIQICKENNNKYEGFDNFIKEIDRY